MRKSVVRLSPTAREPLLTLVTTGRAAAAKRLRARSLRKADVDAGARRWTDADMAAAVDTSASTLQRGSQAWVAQGREAAFVRRRPTGRQYRTLAGAQEAQLMAGACSPSPDGRRQWTLELLADRVVAGGIVATSRAECGRTTFPFMADVKCASMDGSPLRTESWPVTLSEVRCLCQASRQPDKSSLIPTWKDVQCGAAVVLVPVHHPLHTAVRIATPDRLSGGRVELGVDRSGCPYQLTPLGVALEDWRGM